MIEIINTKTGIEGKIKKDFWPILKIYQGIKKDRYGCFINYNEADKLLNLQKQTGMFNNTVEFFIIIDEEGKMNKVMCVMSENRWVKKIN